MNIGAALEQDVPGIAVEYGGRSDKLGAVDDGSATHCQQVIDAVALHHGYRFHQGFKAGVGFNAAKQLYLAVTQCGFYFAQGAGAAGTVAAKQNQDLGVGGHQGVESGNFPFAEGNAGGVVEIEVVHGAVSLIDGS